MKYRLLNALAGILCAILAYTLFVPPPRDVEAATAVSQYHHLVRYNPHCTTPCPDFIVGPSRLGELL